jgi:hypothetical protein
MKKHLQNYHRGLLFDTPGDIEAITTIICTGITGEGGVLRFNILNIFLSFFIFAFVIVVIQLQDLVEHTLSSGKLTKSKTQAL